MKLVIVLSASVLLFLPTVGRADDTDHAITQLKSERYQIIQVNSSAYEGSGGDGTSDIKRVIKIDTLTGNTWELVSSFDKQHTYSWLPLTEISREQYLSIKEKK